MEQRRPFSTWIIEQPDGFLQRTIWTDVLHQRTSRMNDDCEWAQGSLNKIAETNDCKDKSMKMFFVIVDGRIPVVNAFVDENERPVSINGSCYLQLLRDTMRPALR